jgi:hypothetical protein
VENPNIWGGGGEREREREGGRERNKKQNNIPINSELVEEFCLL